MAPGRPLSPSERRAMNEIRDSATGGATSPSTVSSPRSLTRGFLLSEFDRPLDPGTQIQVDSMLNLEFELGSARAEGNVTSEVMGVEPEQLRPSPDEPVVQEMLVEHGAELAASATEQEQATFEHLDSVVESASDNLLASGEVRGFLASEGVIETVFDLRNLEESSLPQQGSTERLPNTQEDRLGEDPEDPRETTKEYITVPELDGLDLDGDEDHKDPETFRRLQQLVESQCSLEAITGYQSSTLPPRAAADGPPEATPASEADPEVEMAEDDVPDAGLGEWVPAEPNEMVQAMLMFDKMLGKSKKVMAAMARAANDPTNGAQVREQMMDVDAHGRLLASLESEATDAPPPAPAAGAAVEGKEDWELGMEMMLEQIYERQWTREARELDDLQGLPPQQPSGSRPSTDATHAAKREGDAPEPEPDTFEACIEQLLENGVSLRRPAAVDDSEALFHPIESSGLKGDVGEEEEAEDALVRNYLASIGLPVGKKYSPDMIMGCKDGNDDVMVDSVLSKDFV